ncbi:hypothetical protein LCGC14_1769580 [marine sediment metagenome]|uniref:Uncharacterized protein n=1 Tax=marine sediment metagenome TaxID=412755 RepID=A0A0F9JDM0_9ZZZZ
MPKLDFSRCLVCKCRGLCCYFSTLIDGKHNIILESHPCSFLNTKTGLCIDYENRKEVYENCLDIEQAKQTGGLPEGCLHLEKGVVYPYPHKRRLREDDNERIKVRTAYINSMPHKNFQEYVPEFVNLLSDELKEEKTT